MSQESRRPMHFALSLVAGGAHVAGWRFPDGRPDDFPYLELFTEMSRAAERGRFDAIFLAETLAMDPAFIERQVPLTLEPIVAMTALAERTETIGLIVTSSTTYNEPSTLARQLATLDHVSVGRSGWNIVTSTLGAENYGTGGLPSHTDRYRRAHEFLDVTKALWKSWPAKSVAPDPTSGIYGDPSLVHPIKHQGEFFSVQGPLTVPTPPQGRPVLVQAGSSEEGRELAAAHAEVVFTAQPDLSDGKSFYADIKRRVKENGRDPDQVKVLPGASPIIAGTEREAHQLVEDLGELLYPPMALRFVSSLLGDADLSGLDLDQPVPLDRLPALDEIKGNKSRAAIFAQYDKGQRQTLRQMIALATRAWGHWSPVGAPEQVAQQLIDRFEAGAADGYIITPAWSPGAVEAFVDHVIPILQKRGYARRDYEENTLRGHLGLKELEGEAL